VFGNRGREKLETGKKFKDSKTQKAGYNRAIYGGFNIVGYIK
jgi:hypothetical protein